MRPSHELKPGGHRDGLAIHHPRLEPPALPHRREQIAFPPRIGRFQDAQIGWRAVRAYIERHRHGRVFFHVHCCWELHLHQNRTARTGRRLKSHAYRMPVPQGPRRPEENFLIHPHRHRHSVPHSRSELPRAQALDGVLIQPQSQRPRHLNIARLAVGAHHNGQQHAALEFRQLRLFAVWRRSFRNHERGCYVRTRTIYRGLRRRSQRDRSREPASYVSVLQILL